MTFKQPLFLKLSFILVLTTPLNTTRLYIFIAWFLYYPYCHFIFLSMLSFSPFHFTVMFHFTPPQTGPSPSLRPSPSLPFIFCPFLHWHPPRPPSSLFHHAILLCWRVCRRVPIATRHFCWPLPRFAWQSCRAFSHRAKTSRVYCMSARTQLNTHAHTLYTHNALLCHAWTCHTDVHMHAYSNTYTKSETQVDNYKQIRVEHFYFLLKITFITVTVVQPIIIIWNMSATIITLENWRTSYPPF